MGHLATAERLLRALIRAILLSIGHKLEVIFPLQVLLIADMIDLREYVSRKRADLFAGDEQLTLYLMRELWL
jgi:hypothetical protein